MIEAHQKAVTAEIDRRYEEDKPTLDIVIGLLVVAWIGATVLVCLLAMVGILGWLKALMGIVLGAAILVFALPNLLIFVAYNSIAKSVLKEWEKQFDG